VEKLWLYWIIAGFVFMIIEIFTPGFVSFLIGISCLITAFFAWIKVPLPYQLLIFALATLFMSFIARPHLVKFFFRNHKEDETNVHGLIGKTGMVTEEINNDISQGRIKLGGEIWRAVTKDDTCINLGQKVIVKSIEGNKVIVELLPNEAKEGGMKC
jgi:membrane protein implicated in regulation of membrane protease activity